MGRFKNSLALAESSWEVLKTDKHLMVIPVVSFFATVVTTIVMGGAVYLTFTSQSVTSGSVPKSSAVNAINVSPLSGSGSVLQPTPFTYVIGVVGYLAITFVVTFFAAALVAGAYERLNGGSPTLGSAFSMAGKRFPQIFAWSMLAGTVGLVLQMIESRAGIFGQIVSRVVGMAWRIVTWLAIPVIVAEGPGPIESLKRSATLFRKTWGENLIGQGGLGLISFGLMAFGLLVSAGIATLSLIVGIAVFVLWIAVTATVMATLNGIYRTALYMYAAGRQVQWFDEQTLANAFRPRKSILH